MIRSLSERLGRTTGLTGNEKRRGRRPGRNSSDTNDNDDHSGRQKNIQNLESDAEDDDDANSVYSTITVETIRTVENENIKPLAAPDSGGGHKRSTQVFVGGKSPLQDLHAALNDVTKLSVYAKNVTLTKEIASKFVELVRGDNRSWEAIAVDILRQKVRWNSIVFQDCSCDGEDNEMDFDGIDGDLSLEGGDVSVNYLDLILSTIINVDNCTYIHLTGIKWSLSTSFAMQSIVFSTSLKKLQLDFIDLSKHVPALALTLSQNKSLTCFIASRCGLEDDHLGVLLGQLPRRLEELRLFGNKCRAKGLASLTDILQSRSKCYLKILDLSYQHVGPNEEFDLSWFAEALAGNRTLKVLDLDNDSLDDSHLSHIVAALCRNKTLEELMLNHNKITGSGVAMLAEKFGAIKGLKKISMYSNVFDSVPAPSK